MMVCVGPLRLMASSIALPLRVCCQSDLTVSSDSPSPAGISFLPRITLKKPSWVVRTESNVRREKRKKPEPSCLVCSGSGKINCHHCRGRGRTNFVNLVILPKGEWPKWCRACGGSGLGYCSRCLGTGEHREIMGFHFMKLDPNSTRSPRSNQSTQQQN